jgi:hypothetical protein
MKDSRREKLSYFIKIMEPPLRIRLNLLFGLHCDYTIGRRIPRTEKNDYRITNNSYPV